MTNHSFQSTHRSLTFLGCATAVGILLAAGCGAESPAPPVGQVSAATLAAPPASVDHADEICSGRRMVGRVPLGANCPQATGGWQGGKLFAGLNHGDGGLGRFCVYKWQGSAPPSAQQIANLPSVGPQTPAEWLDKDCAAVGAASPTEDARAEVQPTLHQSFLTQVGAPAALPSGGASVRVAVLDSRPEVTGLFPEDQMGHGLGMVTIIQNLTCNLMAGLCPIQMRPHLALNLESPTTVNNVDGGFYGYQSFLARKLVEAVHLQQLEAPTARLVINLSLGWDAVFNTGTAHPTSDAVIAVHSALRYATCQGALVLAAAGNDGGANTPPGPVYPAAWEQQTVTCGGPYRPLLHSVGGIKADDNPLFNVRAGGRPRLAAPAHLATPDHPTRLLGPYTGTSAAVAVASAAAALVWSQQPGLSSQQVMGRLFAGSVALGEPADYCAAPPCGTIRRLSLCDVAEDAYGPLACTTPAAGAGSNPVFPSSTGGVLAGLTVDSFAGTASSPYVPAYCGAPVTPVFSTQTPPAPLPEWYRCAADYLPNANAVAVLEPQPTSDPCGSCFLELTAPADPLILYIFVADDFASDAYPMTLDLLNDRGSVLESVDLTQLVDGGGNALADGLAPGASATVELTNVPAVAYEGASIQWLTDVSNPRTSVQSAVVLR
jgi:Subtilase family